MDYPTNSEFANLYKYISPNFNPGVRQWAGVEPEKHIVEFDELEGSFMPPAGFPENPKTLEGFDPSIPLCCYGKNDVEPFGISFDQRLSLSKDSILRILIFGVVAYLIWYYIKEYKK